MSKKSRKTTPEKLGLTLLLSRLKLDRKGWCLVSVCACLLLSVYVFDNVTKNVDDVSSESKLEVPTVIEKAEPAGNKNKVIDHYDHHHPGHEHNCFCQLHGAINDDCACQIDAVDQFNNFKVHPRLQSLLQKDYFRYVQVNLNKKCPFWQDDGTCSFEFCQVKACGENEVPAGIKGQRTANGLTKKTTEPAVQGCANDEDLGYINMTLSAESKKGFERWKTHDDSLTDFCTVNDDATEEDMVYVDLLLNPERFTGYSGPSSHRVWSSIYNENCFKEASTIADVFSVPKNDTCIEKRTFYRAISGLHSSISIHLSYKYLLGRSSPSSLFSTKSEMVWGPNVTEFKKHFPISTANSEAHSWLKNLYFVYLLELKAMTKVTPYLHQFEFYTGDSEEDADMKLAVQDLLKVLESFPYHFEEKALFSTKDAAKLKLEVHRRFTNITRIMDCVGCQKCKLWGKIQTKGLGTALKILFSEKFRHTRKTPVFLDRNEIVSLFNAFGRLSESIHALGKFRTLIEQDEGGTGPASLSSSSKKQLTGKLPF